MRAYVYVLFGGQLEHSFPLSAKFQFAYPVLDVRLDGFHFVAVLDGQELFDLFEGEDETEASDSGTRVRA